VSAYLQHDPGVVEGHLNEGADASRLPESAGEVLQHGEVVGLQAWTCGVCVCVSVGECFEERPSVLQHREVVGLRACT